MWDLIGAFSRYADSFLILFYRITGHCLINYFIGTFLLAFICVLIGELTVSLAITFNRGYLDELAQEITEKERASLVAYQAGDKAGYKALNREATDVWGKRFFTMIAYSAGILWPIPFALAWMQTRFQGIDFPVAFPLSLIFGKSVGYTFTFIPLYILCRIIFKYMRPWIPYFRKIEKLLLEYDPKGVQ